jgi:hypothetical protein
LRIWILAAQRKAAASHSSSTTLIALSTGRQSLRVKEMSEGSAKAPQIRDSPYVFSRRQGRCGLGWSRLWSFRVANALDASDLSGGWRGNGARAATSGTTQARLPRVGRCTGNGAMEAPRRVFSQTPEESRTTRTTPGWRRPLTDRPSESHRRLSGRRVAVDLAERSQDGAGALIAYSAGEVGLVPRLGTAWSGCCSRLGLARTAPARTGRRAWSISLDSATNSSFRIRPAHWSRRASSLCGVGSAGWARDDLLAYGDRVRL